MLVTAINPVPGNFLCFGSQLLSRGLNEVGTAEEQGMESGSSSLEAEAYFSLATTNSGAQSKARLISESGKVQIDFCADSA